MNNTEDNEKVALFSITESTTINSDDTEDTLYTISSNSRGVKDYPTSLRSLSSIELIALSDFINDYLRKKGAVK